MEVTNRDEAKGEISKLFSEVIYVAIPKHSRSFQVSYR